MLESEKAKPTWIKLDRTWDLPITSEKQSSQVYLSQSQYYNGSTIASTTIFIRKLYAEKTTFYCDAIHTNFVFSVILFSKSERKMTFEQFEVAVGLLAEKKYAGAANGLERIKVKLLSGSGPTTHGATVSALFRGNVLAILTKLVGLLMDPDAS